MSCDFWILCFQWKSIGWQLTQLTGHHIFSNAKVRRRVTTAEGTSRHWCLSTPGNAQTQWGLDNSMGISGSYNGGTVPYKAIFWGYIPLHNYIDLIGLIYMVGASNWGSWNGHWLMDFNGKSYSYIYNGYFFMAMFDYPKGAAMLYIGFYKLNIGRQYTYIYIYVCI